MELTDVQNKESDIGFIPHDWEVKRIDEIAIIDPESLSNSSTNPDYTFKYISLEDVDYGVLKNYTELKFSNAPSRARRIVKRNDILFSTVRPNLKSHLHITSNVYDLICSTGFSVIRCNENACGGYVFNHLFASIINSQVNNLITGSNYPAINSKEVRSLKIPFPREKSEQTAIATALSDTDALIENLEKLIVKKQNIKQGVMQELLKPKKNYALKKLGEIFDFKQGVQCPVEKQYYAEGTGLKRFIRIIDLTQPEELPRFISDPGSSHHINKNDLFMVRYGTPGLLGFGYEGVIANNLFRLLPKKSISTHYFYYLLFYNNSDISNISSSTTMAAINFTALKELELSFPLDIDRQIQIANIISEMDNEIESIVKVLRKYKMIRLGMMQALLTGKIRLL